MARHFNYYEPWRTEPLACPCGWQGTFEQGHMEPYAELLESACPNCEKIVAMVSYPTAAEVERNEPPNSPFRKTVAAAERRRLVFESLRLRFPDQLPEITGANFVITWDFAEDTFGEKWTVLRHVQREIFRELAFWEGWKRFMEVGAILQQKYGTRLTDFLPSEASLLYLLGDNLGADDIIARYRSENFSGAGQ